MSRSLPILGAVAAVLLGAAPAQAATCRGADAVPQAASRPAVAAATLCLINAERAAHGLRPLHTRASLVTAARGHAADMVRRRYFSHTAPGGKGVVTRVRRAG